MMEGAREGGMSAESARFFESAEEAAVALGRELREGDLVLVKGSRGVRMDKVIAFLRERFPVAGEDKRN
jgi:UDP-N-acetylmuramoyl-tripeptide--D-alanyl-D-alanine ligase